MEKLDSTSSRALKFKTQELSIFKSIKSSRRWQETCLGEQGDPDKTWAQKEGCKKEEQGLVAKAVE